MAHFFFYFLTSLVASLHLRHQLGFINLNVLMFINIWDWINKMSFMAINIQIHNSDKYENDEQNKQNKQNNNPCWRATIKKPIKTVGFFN